MSVSGASLSAPVDRSIPDQTTPQLTYEYVDEGFYYTVAYSTRGREFVSLPDFTATQVQELFENGKVFPPENLDGGESFGFTHGWPIGSNKVGIVAEDGVLCCTVFDETGNIISDEEIPQNDSDGRPLAAGEIYCNYSQRTPFVRSDGKVSFFYFSQLDPSITIDASHWAVTLVNIMPPGWRHGHAVLLIEKFNKNGQYKMMRAHFTANERISGKKEAVTKIFRGIIDYEKVDPSYPYHSKTETWSLSKDNVKQMIDEIKEEISRQDTDIPVFFSGRGSWTLFTPMFIKTPEGQRSVENCLTWAIKKLLAHGVIPHHLPIGIFMNRPVEYISSYEKTRDKAIEDRQKRNMVKTVAERALNGLYNSLPIFITAIL